MTADGTSASYFHLIQSFFPHTMLLQGVTWSKREEEVVSQINTPSFLWNPFAASASSDN